MSYHNKIMGIEIVDDEPRARTLNYKIGHKDARFAAAEIANEADTTIQSLVEACEKCEQLLLSHGDPFRGDDWQMMQDVRAAIAKAKGEAK